MSGAHKGWGACRTSPTGLAGLMDGGSDSAALTLWAPSVGTPTSDPQLDPLWGSLSSYVALQLRGPRGPPQPGPLLSLSHHMVSWRAGWVSVTVTQS